MQRYVRIGEDAPQLSQRRYRHNRVTDPICPADNYFHSRLEFFNAKTQRSKDAKFLEAVDYSVYPIAYSDLAKRVLSPSLILISGIHPSSCLIRARSVTYSTGTGCGSGFLSS